MSLKTTSLTALGVICVIAVSSLGAQSVEPFQFPENPVYGYVRTDSSKTDSGSVFYLMRFGQTPGETAHTILDSVVGLSPPQMCDTNAVSFRAFYRPDSSMLVVAYLGQTVKLDTMLVYAEKEWRKTTEHRIPNGRVSDLYEYLFALRDSTLLWIPPQGHGRRFLEIGRIGADNVYEFMKFPGEASLPAFTSDFSEALFVSTPTVPSVKGFDEGTTLVKAYDFKSDSLRLVQRVNCEFRQVRRRSQGGPLFGVCSSGNYWDSLAFSLSVAKDSVPRLLVTFEWPTSIRTYHLYPDSIVVETVKNCDESYGVKTHVIHE